MTHPPLTIVAIDTPPSVTGSYVVHDGTVAFVVDPQRDIDRILTCSRGRRPADRTSSRPTCTTTTSPAAWRWRRRTGAAYLVNAADDGRLRPHAGPRRRRVAGRRRMRHHRGCHPGAHLHPPRRTRSTDAGRRRRRSRSSPAARCSTAPPAGPDLLGADAHRRTGPPPARLGPPARGRCCPTTPAVFPTHGFGSSAPPPVRGDLVDDRQERRTNPALTQDEQAYVDELLAGLGACPAYYAHMAPAQRRRARPRRTCPRPTRADAVELRRRIDGRGVGGRPAEPDRVRRRPRAGHAELRARRLVRHLPRAG